MSNYSRTKLFWSGTEGRNAARVAAKQADEQLQARMAKERVEAKYRELKQNAKRRGNPPGAETKRKDAAEGRAMQAI
jgi:hypothetical protein